MKKQHKKRGLVLTLLTFDMLFMGIGSMNATADGTSAGKSESMPNVTSFSTRAMGRLLLHLTYLLHQL